MSANEPSPPPEPGRDEAGAIKQGLEASRAEMSGSPAGPTEEQLAALSPEQRSAYEANSGLLLSVRRLPRLPPAWAGRRPAAAPRDEPGDPVGAHLVGREPDGALAFDGGEGSCPVGYNCKHVAAIVMAALDAPAPPAAGNPLAIQLALHATVGSRSAPC